MNTEATPARRALPVGYDDETSPYFIPRPLRSYYQTVTAPAGKAADVCPLAYHLRVLDLACDWIELDQRSRYA
ncbi:hypothetical protein [Rhodococcus aetherivorans]|uniref:hypothetical protein n=1 Tax=Rhodococcus aetherivorans TaxID=191292 RepID=UPI00045D2488|nr:hypothetical protein [Rhodococcus aetherivorans]KDE10126.1 hypothetical protein N505_0126885 [Rhodococcus aetherivorans]MDV6296986.1 hypothetical protein [Rhodococcus aetherivorans]